MGNDKLYEARMQGMIYATRLAQEQGIDELVKEVKRRGVTKVDLYVTQSKLQEIWDALSNNIYTNMLTTVAWVLHDTYGFGAERLKKFKAKYDKAIEDTLDLDYLGEHYVRLEDYAIELNKKYNLGIDVNVVAYCEEKNDESSPTFKNTFYLDGIINSLRIAGYNNAADYLESKKEK